MLNAKVRFLFVAGCFVMLGTCLVGCGGSVAGPPTEPVSGVVTLDGTPVANANVVFVPDGKGGRGAAGTTDETGKYTLTTFNPQDGAMVGNYKIMVTKAAAAGPVANLDLSGLSPEEADKKARQAFNKGGGAANAYGRKGPAGTANELPNKYSNIAQSGLKANVVKGPNTVDLPLTSGD